MTGKNGYPPATYKTTIKQKPLRRGCVSGVLCSIAFETGYCFFQRRITPMPSA